MALERIGILGGGSWATALAKIVLETTPAINWYIRREEQVKHFIASGHNPDYLSSAEFDTRRITFYSEGAINNFFRACDTIILVTPSPYFKSYMKKVKKASIRDKALINAIKGIVPEENLLISEYFKQEYNHPQELIGVVAGPCHAEEVARERRSYLTVGSYNPQLAQEVAKALQCEYISCTISEDVIGIEFASVLKNIYAVAAGICNGLNYGDNFQSVLISNAIAEMNSFVNTVHLLNRRVITNSVYLGDLLVTAYSNHSRNRTFGTMIGKGYSVKSAQIEMEMIAEGYYGAKCVHELNSTHYRVNMPIMDTVYEILYERAPAKQKIQELSLKFR